MVAQRPVALTTSSLQRDMYENYSQSVGLEPRACYIHGTPLRPVVPLDIGTASVFFLGAYPSARFAMINGISDVPVADNLGPFESERWFDGARVRQQPSARELHELFLGPLKLDRASCWITDLVKVFLFKPGHIERYRRLSAEAPAGYVRERFLELAKASVCLLERELELARPRLLVTLGAEVAGVLRGVSLASAQTRLLVAKVEPLQIGTMSIPTIHCAHPGILMRRQLNNPWPDQHSDSFIPAIREYLASADAAA